MGTSSLPILIVGSNLKNLDLLAQFLSKEGYQSIAVSKLEMLAELLNTDQRFGLAMVDIAGFDKHIWEYCEQCADREIPLLIISPQKVLGIQQESLSHGAQGVLFKPLVIKEMLGVINALFVEN